MTAFFSKKTFANLETNFPRSEMPTLRTRRSIFGTLQGGFPKLKPVLALRKAAIVEQPVALLELPAAIARQEMNFPELQAAIVGLEPELFAFAETLCVLKADIAPNEMEMDDSIQRRRRGIYVATRR